MNKPGSTLLIALIAVTFVACVALNSLRRSGYLLDLSLQRITHVKNYLALDGALANAIALYSTQQLVSQFNWVGETIIFCFVQENDQNVLINIEMQKDNDICGKAFCSLRITDKGLILDEWKLVT